MSGLRSTMPGTNRRRLAAISVSILGALDILLAAKRRPIVRIALFHPGRQHVATVTSRYVLLVCGLVLLGSLRSLWHGKRRSWQICVAVVALSAIAHPLRRGDLVGLAPTIAVGLGLLASRRFFPARGDPAYARQGVRWLLFGSTLVFVYGTAGLWLFDNSFREPNELGESAVQALRLLFILPSTTIDPVTHHGSWFIDSVRFMMIVVVLVSAWHLVHPVILRASAHRSEHDQIQRLLEQHATTGLAYFHLLDDKLRYLADDGRAFLTYRLVGSTAVALGEPIGEPDSCRAVARSFVEYCELNGWAVAFHQVSEPGAELLSSIGLRRLKIGEEAIVPVQTFALEGSHFKRTRSKNRQLEREGVTIEELIAPIDDDTMDELRDVSDAWLADGGHRERTFTLGSFDPHYLHETTVLVARSPGGRIEAFVNVLPSFQSRIGNFDLMRRRPDSPNGVMELMLVHLIERFRAEGDEGMTLGFAPLANIEGEGIVARTLRAIYERESTAFNFKGLFEFKDKWRPRWEPRYLVYRSDLQLPKVALAVARVGERHDHAPALLRLGLHATSRR